jgi:hypothetical protein
VRYVLLVVGVLAFLAGLAAAVIGVLDFGWGLLLCPAHVVQARYFCSQSVREGVALLMVGLTFNAIAYFALRYRDRPLRVPAA